MKQRFINLVKTQKVFLIGWLLIVMALTMALGFTDKATLHVALNDGIDLGHGTGLHTPFLDQFFFYFTKIAEYVPYIVIVALLFYQYGWAIIAALGQLGATLTTQALKHIFNHPRPKTFFESNYPELIPDLHWLEQLNMHSWYSFPSGHTTAFFSLFFLLSLMTDKKWLQALYLVLAALGGYSRIYLSQHFSADVLAGCIIGVVLTAIIYSIPWPQNQPWARKSLRDVRCKK